MKNTPKSAFTLLELLIVITIVAILAGAMIPLFKSSRQEAEMARERTDLDTLVKVARTVYLDVGWIVLPMWFNRSTAPWPGWKGPYVAEEPRDAWGNTYTYQTDGSGHIYYVSCGPNKIFEAGAGDDLKVYVGEE